MSESKNKELSGHAQSKSLFGLIKHKCEHPDLSHGFETKTKTKKV